ncbi:uncharacterized protein (DUF924 family) [Hasllibacter halocynthiae]|uniref:Uncharacterized protein (DUF924 family) n=1 Tax=Hasllibacter halocynthiae TaxID=595589 RepID=A0A2T0X7T1_9RHOB|nr:DUF924 family protein [Hasllibacter halocynthiae]PRY95010.1 uncharacterized protein (DUF924 family) [Hasllibacter halocynthiae]
MSGTDEVDDVLAFWLDEVGPEGWYKGSEALDARIRARFLGLWHQAAAGALSLWLTYPEGALAYCILTDQLPRNMFRGTGKAFSTDRIARRAACMAVSRGWDRRIEPPARQFFYLPFEHSEARADQDRAVRLIAERLPAMDETLLHARAHREVIRRFGRFPFRNDALDRAHTPEERDWMSSGGYGRTVRAMGGDMPDGAP